MCIFNIFISRYCCIRCALSVPRAASGATHSGATHGKVRDKIVHECCRAGTHGCLAVRTDLFLRLNSRVLPHRHQVLGRRCFAAKERLQKQGPKTIGTKTCFARTHTHKSLGTQRFRRDNLGCPSRSCDSTAAARAHMGVSPLSPFARIG